MDGQADVSYTSEMRSEVRQRRVKGRGENAKAFPEPKLQPCTERPAPGAGAEFRAKPRGEASGLSAICCRDGLSAAVTPALLQCHQSKSKRERREPWEGRWRKLWSSAPEGGSGVRTWPGKCRGSLESGRRAGASSQPPASLVTAGPRQVHQRDRDTARLSAGTGNLPLSATHFPVQD